MAGGAMSPFVFQNEANTEGGGMSRILESFRQPNIENWYKVQNDYFRNAFETPQRYERAIEYVKRLNISYPEGMGSEWYGVLLAAAILIALAIDKIAHRARQGTLRVRSTDEQIHTTEEEVFRVYSRLPPGLDLVVAQIAFNRANTMGISPELLLAALRESFVAAMVTVEVPDGVVPYDLNWDEEEFNNNLKERVAFVTQYGLDENQIVKANSIVNLVKRHMKSDGPQSRSAEFLEYQKIAEREQELLQYIRNERVRELRELHKVEEDRVSHVEWAVQTLEMIWDTVSLDDWTGFYRAWTRLNKEGLFTTLSTYEERGPEDNT